ncbi:diacylglycerol lipase-alpha [Caerostris extrusa]|uniref:Diacylglycerol lipase-alpha n=1 Tax=Caerostris extrusa TaxID=172846 RepID=A0AAV4TSL9_CAEEX|nr:diacylglycerol lipase-alpha [Caerostris extrusa]
MVSKLVVLTVVLTVVDFNDDSNCISDLYEHVLGYMVILFGCVVVEAFIAWVSMKGTILIAAPRSSMQYLLYVRLGILVVEVGWLVVGVIWLVNHYPTCPVGLAKDAVLGIVISNWLVLLSVLITTWCTFDAAGRSWVKMKKYQMSMKQRENERGQHVEKPRIRRSGASHRNWRHRKAMREYQDSWNRRCRILFCCLGYNDQKRNNFADIAKLLSDFFPRFGCGPFGCSCRACATPEITANGKRGNSKQARRRYLRISFGRTTYSSNKIP